MIKTYERMRSIIRGAKRYSSVENLCDVVDALVLRSQEQEKKIEALEKRIATLEAAINWKPPVES